MAFHFGKYHADTAAVQQGHRTGHAEDALDKDDQKKAPQKHQDKVRDVRVREHGKQTTTMPPDHKKSWGGTSDDLKKVK